MKTSRGLAAPAAVMLLLTGCTDGDPEGAATTPRADAVHEGWVAFERDGVRLAHPPDWEVRDEDDGRVDLVGPEGGDLAPAVSVRWDSPVGLSASESLQVATGNVVTTMPDVEPGEAETFETTGSLEAAKRRIEYTQPLTDGEIAVIELQAVVLGEAVEVLVRAVHRADEFEQVEDTFEDIAASIDVVATGSGVESAMPSPDEIVPSDPSGFGAYVAPGGRFTVDLPSGWGVTLMDGLAIARPEGGGPGSMIMIGSEQVDRTDTSAVLERMELEPASEGEEVEVPGATTAQRFSGEAFAPYDLVVAVDDSGHAAAVAVFDAGEVDDEVREQVLGSVAYTGT